MINFADTVVVAVCYIHITAAVKGYSIRIVDVTAKSQKSRISKQEKPYRIAKYYRENRRNTTINQKFGGFSNCLSQIMIIFKEKYLAISSGSTPL
jgi:hypothetical protein